MRVPTLPTNRGPKQYGFVDDARRNQTPYTIDVIGLNEEDLHWPRYVSELRNRQVWCREFCRDDWDIEPIRDQQMRLIGRRFRFADVVDAVYFKLRFDTLLQPAVTRT